MTSEAVSLAGLKQLAPAGDQARRRWHLRRVARSVLDLAQLWAGQWVLLELSLQLSSFEMLIAGLSRPAELTVKAFSKRAVFDLFV